ncbi:hypothetical protein ES332_A11G321500v1 [Gossypium tomentosum]|uniref:EH domain-containing protein n=1 Tax=Gossypium tomentosum TaxID=34277 RepID=A0A5D2NGH8_GOSTO|nr:hypothetical protein ES332_A11G321500v1 [Gossypium tomentosum]
MEIEAPRIGSCSKEHQKIYKEWFDVADSDNDGRVTGNNAISFLSMSNLSRQELKQVWAIADSKRQGYLGFKEFVIAMQLVSLVQDGNELSHDILMGDVDFENVKPPKMEGLDELIQKKKDPSNSSKPDSDGNSPRQASITTQWFSSKPSKRYLSNVTSIQDGLKKLYTRKLKPLEVTYCFNDFVSPLLTNSDFDAKPMVMLLGQYSTGKTTFSKHMLKCSYPGVRIGPEPTTDRFVVVMSGTDERSVPGNTIAVHADMPFTGLNSFGTAFLSKFECSQMPHPLMRIYGALMWSLGKVLNTPEVVRVYIGSFNEKPVNEGFTGPIGKALFEKEQEDLLTDLKDIPKKACDRRINEFVKRARAAKIHAYIVGHLKKEMPTFIGKAKTQQRLTDNLEEEFVKVQRDYHLPPGDFPDVENFKEVLRGYSFDRFEKLKPKMIQDVDEMLGYDIPNLLKTLRNPYD